MANKENVFSSAPGASIIFGLKNIKKRITSDELTGTLKCTRYFPMISSGGMYKGPWRFKAIHKDFSEIM